MRIFSRWVHKTKPIFIFSFNFSTVNTTPTHESVVDALRNIKSLPQGRQIHAHMFISGIEINNVTATKLVSMYAKCGNLKNARMVFDKMLNPNVYLWNAMIGGYARNGYCKEALKLYHQMQEERMQPDSFTFPSVLKACSSLAALQEGNEIHDLIVRVGAESNIFVGSALVDMYAKCNRIEEAREVFDKMSQRDAVSWNAMIAGYAQSGHCDEALKVFRQMGSEGQFPNSVTVASVLPACAHLADLRQGREVHDYIARSGFEWNVFVGNALVDMYAKCGSMEDAQRLFDKMSQRDVVSWTAIITGYVQDGNCYEALRLFHEMQLAGVKPDSVIVASILPACGRLAALQQGREIHDYIVRLGLESDVVVGNALIDMYAKCGSVENALHQFDKMHVRDVISWNAIITGYGMNGHAEDALQFFSQMQQGDIKPNNITFTGVLSACSHAGLLNEGMQYFDQMVQDYSIEPTMDHYTCMVDLLGRAGCLNEAHAFIQKMPFEPDAGVWGALLGACRIHSNLTLGISIAEHLLELEHPGYYVLLSNIYAAAGRWDGVGKVRAMMRNKGIKKNPGCSWIHVKNKVHTFITGRKSHPQLPEIYAMLDNLAGKMKETGFVPSRDFALHDVEEEEKEQILCGHSEKLAVAFGLMNTCPGSPIRIAKNLRVCGDCHIAIKIISKIVAREIIVRDTNRFHHFKNGLCSCGDYW